MAAANGAAVGSPEAVTAKLLDFAQPLDVSLLDSTVNAFYGAGSNQEVSANAACCHTQCVFLLWRWYVPQAFVPPCCRAAPQEAVAAEGCNTVDGQALQQRSQPLPCAPRHPTPPAAATRQLPAACSLLQRMAAEAVLKAVQEHPEAWTRVDAILEHSKNQQTKFFGLQVRRRWRRRRQQYPAGLATRCCCCCSVLLWLIV